jgi:type IV secretory pathway VirB3-like protein
MIGYMANEERPPTGFGCLSMIIGVVVLTALVVLVFFVGFVALGIVAALLVIGLLALAVDRVMLALSPKRRERRAHQSGVFVWRFGQVPSGEVIDTTAIDTTESLDNPRPNEQGPDELRPE